MRSTDSTSPLHGTTLFAPALAAERRRSVDVRPPRRTRSVLAGLAAVGALFVGACSTPGEPAQTGDPVDGTADIELDDVGVEDGTEGGVNLGNGNVPGNWNDQDLDPLDEENDLNTTD